MMNCELKKTYKSGNSIFSLDIQASFKLNAINVLYGVSGSGKTSLLRLLSGLDTPDTGVIKIHKNTWYHSALKINVPVAHRNIAYVFQEVGLFPNMTVLENIEFAKKGNNSTLLQELLETLKITNLLNNYPLELSGGQQQRVALARAIMQEPDFLFLDEPLTAIDETLRNDLQKYLITLQRKYKFTIIMISHYLSEVLKVADYVCELKNGKVIHQGAPSLLISKNNHNTLKAIVLSIHKDVISVVVGHQQINILRKNIVDTVFSVGSEINITI